MPQQNFMNNINFRLIIDRLPDTEFFVQSVDLPSISIGERIQPSPFKPIYHHGDTLDYGEFNVTVKADLYLKSYQDVLDWMVGLSFPEEFKEHKNLKESKNGLYSDISLMIANNRSVPIINLKFFDAFPTSLSNIQIDTVQSDINPPTFDITFKHNKHKFIDVE